MKKTLCTLLVLCGLLLSACGGNTTVDPTPTKSPSDNTVPTDTATETETETETESQTPGVTPEEESELASEGIRTENRSTEKDSESKYYLTSQYLLVPSFKNLKKDRSEERR